MKYHGEDILIIWFMSVIAFCFIVLGLFVG